MKEETGFRAVARPGLESIRLLLKLLGNPERDLKYIHVAGTNGKGSVCAFLQEMFTAAGYRTGKYTSPNLIRVNERITVDGCEIRDDALQMALEQVQKAAVQAEQILGEMPTQFELWTAAALCHFKNCGCDIVIMETGLGGARDATNIIPPPLASVITRVAADHMEYLGSTLAEIAAAKAGIIKRHAGGKAGYTVTVRQAGEVMPVLEQACADCGNQLVVTGIPVLHTPNGIYECFDYGGICGLELGLGGRHQIENACVAIETARIFGISEESIRRGLKSAKNPARLEMISAAPFVIFDGAHNPNGMRALIENLDRYFPNEARTIVIGCMRDKDIAGLFAEIKKSKENIRRVLTVQVRDNPRAAEADLLAGHAHQAGIPAQACSDIRSAYRAAADDGGIVVICGSLYLYKDLKEAAL